MKAIDVFSISSKICMLYPALTRFLHLVLVVL